ncbi:MAG: peroxiredoxin family protein [Terriglobia bacterium]
MTTLSKGQAAPGFELKGVDGASYSLKGLLPDRAVLAAFFKVSCPTCQFTLPFLERIHRQARERGGQVLGISQDCEEDTRRFAQKFGLTFPVLIDPKPYAVSREYRLKFVPSLFLVGRDQTIQAACDGFSKPDLLEMQNYLNDASPLPPLFEAGERVPQYKPG